MTFKHISLKQFLAETNLTFRHKYLLFKQQRLSDNLWIAKISHEKLQTLHALAFYFNQLHTQVDINNFSFYLVIHSWQPGIYTYWPHVLQQIENFSNPIFQGFHSYQDVVTEATKYLPIPCRCIYS